MIVPLPEGEVTWDTDLVRRKLVEQLEFDEARHKKEITNLQDEINALHRERDGEVWHWLGDGYDHIESLCCPVLIEPEDLMIIFGKHKKEIEDLFREIEEGLGVSKAVIFYSEWWQVLKSKYLGGK